MVVGSFTIMFPHWDASRFPLFERMIHDTTQINIYNRLMFCECLFVFYRVIFTDGAYMLYTIYVMVNNIPIQWERWNTILSNVRTSFRWWSYFIYWYFYELLVKHYQYWIFYEAVFEFYDDYICVSIKQNSKHDFLFGYLTVTPLLS